MPFTQFPSLSQLVDEVLLNLSGYTGTQDMVTTLADPMDLSDMTFTVASDGILSPGLTEIGDELVLVASVSGAVATVAAGGRNFRSSSLTGPGSYSTGQLVTIAPQFPRGQVFRELTNTIRSLYPDLYAVATSEFTVDGVNYQFELPAEAERILEIRWRYQTQDGWFPVKGWDQINSASSDFTSGRAVSIYDFIPSGSTVRVVYAAQPGYDYTAGGRFDLQTGLPLSCEDVLVMGTTIRMLPGLDFALLKASPVGASTNQRYGAASQLANSLSATFKTRVAQEAAKLKELYPGRVHKVR